MMQKTKRQHYVPQSYLRRFSEDDNSVFVFDKANNSVFESSTRNIAQERFFFELPKETIGNEDPQVLEHIFSEMEAEYASLLDVILSSLARKRRFNPKRKTMMALFVAIQFLRTKEYRQDHAQQREAGLKVINQELAKEGLRLKYGYKDEAANHFIQVFDPELLNVITRALLSHIWIVWNNKTKHPFYTSDNPVVVASAIQEPAGFASPGVEVVLPITSKLLLSICDQRYFSGLSKSDCKSVSLYDVARVEHYNKLQVVSSSRQVYCSIDHFGLARELCKQNPNLRDPNRSRIEVEEVGNIIRFSSKKMG
jgi:hypothetical protein